jgi:hypothetical protein
MNMVYLFLAVTVLNVGGTYLYLDKKEMERNAVVEVAEVVECEEGAACDEPVPVKTAQAQE